MPSNVEANGRVGEDGADQTRRDLAPDRKAIIRACKGIGGHVCCRVACESQKFVGNGVQEHEALNDG